MVRKTKIVEDAKEVVEELPFVPPEVRELAERYVLRLPISEISHEKGWDLRLHISKILESRLGDEVQLTSIKLRKPHLISKSVARLRKQEPCARAYVTIKF